MYEFLVWVAIIILVEVITELIVTESIIFRWLVVRLSNNDVIGEVLHCGDCLSLIISTIFCWAVPGVFVHTTLDYFIKTAIIYRSANVLHELLNRYFNRIPLNIVVNKVGNNDYGTSNPANDQISKSAENVII